MDRALIEHAKDEVDHDERGGDQNGRARQRGLEGLCIALKARCQRGRLTELRLGALDSDDRLPDGDTRTKIEGNRHRGELALMIDHDGSNLLD